MFIRYRIEPVGQKYGWRQGSSDCWYYASKSLLRFYGVANSKVTRNGLFAACQLIRMFINSMRKLHGKDLHHPMLTNVNMGQWINSEIEKSRARAAISWPRRRRRWPLQIGRGHPGRPKPVDARQGRGVVACFAANWIPLWLRRI